MHTRDARIDLADVRDVVRAYRLLVEHGRRGEVYNVGSGVQRTSGQVLDLLRGMADPERPVIELHPGPKQDPIADVTRLVDCTGWRPQIPVEKGLQATVEWFALTRNTPGDTFRGAGVSGVSTVTATSTDLSAALPVVGTGGPAYPEVLPEPAGGVATR